MVLNNLTNVITKQTRVTRLSEALIDPILVTDPVDVIGADILDINPIITVVLKFTFVPMVSPERKVWYYKRAYFNELNRLIITDNMNIDNADTNKLLEIKTIRIPSKQVTRMPNDRPWYEFETKKITRQRHKQKKITTEKDDLVTG